MKKIFLTENQFKLLAENFSDEGFVHDKDYVTYGRNSFDIRNVPRRNKPLGGFWSCPTDSKYGWFEFIESEMPQWKSKLDNNIKFRIDPNANIYVIDSLEDLHQLVYDGYVNYWGGLDRSITIDFEKMAANGFDGIFLTNEGQCKTRITPSFQGMFEFNLYGWDFETLLIMNPNIIQNVTSDWNDGKSRDWNDNDWWDDEE